MGWVFHLLCRWVLGRPLRRAWKQTAGQSTSAPSQCPKCLRKMSQKGGFIFPFLILRSGETGGRRGFWVESQGRSTKPVAFSNCFAPMSKRCYYLVIVWETFGTGGGQRSWLRSWSLVSLWHRLLWVAPTFLTCAPSLKELSLTPTKGS